MTGGGNFHGAGGGTVFQGAGGGAGLHGAGGGQTRGAGHPLVQPTHGYGYYGGYGFYGGYLGYGGYIGTPTTLFSGQSAAQALTDYANNPSNTLISISDTGADVAAKLDALAPIAAAGELSTITLTDPNPPTLAVTQTQLSSDAGVLQHISSEFNLAITATTPNSSITGLGSHDEVILPGASSQYTLTAIGDGTSLTATYNGTGGPDTYQLSNINYLQFTDQTIFVVNSDNANIARLYSAAFGREPDVTGLNYWEDIYANSVPASLKTNPVLALAQTILPNLGNSIAGAFLASPEFTATHGSLSDSAFITDLYTTVLGRAPDAAGLAYWENVLTTDGSSGRAAVLVGFAESPENIAKVGHTWLFQV